MGGKYIVSLSLILPIEFIFCVQFNKYLLTVVYVTGIAMFLDYKDE